MKLNLYQSNCVEQVDCFPERDQLAEHEIMLMKSGKRKEKKWVKRKEEENGMKKRKKVSGREGERKKTEKRKLESQTELKKDRQKR